LPCGGRNRVVEQRPRDGREYFLDGQYLWQLVSRWLDGRQLDRRELIGRQQLDGWKLLRRQLDGWELLRWQLDGRLVQRKRERR